MRDDVKRLSHSKWRCKYHIVFTPKYRRQIIYGKIKIDVGKILCKLSERKGVEIIESGVLPRSYTCTIPKKKNTTSSLLFLEEQ